MDKQEKIFIAGHSGLIGSALTRCLTGHGYGNLVLATRKELDLQDEAVVYDFLRTRRPSTVIMAAGRSGGIAANAARPADFLYQNLKIGMNLIHGSHLAGVERILYIGCSCRYPKDSPQPMRPEHLSTGKFEETSEGFSYGKMATLKMGQAYRAQHGTRFIGCIADTVYGPGDTFDPIASHVVPALIRRFHEAKLKGLREVVVWGTGNAIRSFTFCDDIADCIEFVLTCGDRSEVFNIGSDKPVSIRELANLVKEVTGYAGAVVFDATKPDGAPVKTLDVTDVHGRGWNARTGLKEGLEKTYSWYLDKLKGMK